MDTDLFRRLFKAREDVFAVRWEKGKKSGYMPAYSFDRHHYRLHKMNGGTLASYPNKSHRTLSIGEIQKHLTGVQQIGVYPLLKDDTSWFLVADFDGEAWQKDAVTFLQACASKDIPAYLERSRSGNGGHVWIFFDKPFLAIKSRKLFLSMLERSGAFSEFDKSSSFDRVFPNQDSHSGKGFGNLIALPFFKPAMEKGNCSFISPTSFEPYEDQWAFLEGIQSVTTSRMDSLLQETEGETFFTQTRKSTGNLKIVLDNMVGIPKAGITPGITGFLKEELNIANSEFFVKKKSGRSTYDTPRHFNLITETAEEVRLPRGFAGSLIRHCREKDIAYDFVDKRQRHPLENFSFHATLQEHQLGVIKAIEKKDFGVIVAPPGAGKTIMGLKIVADKKQPALIIVHRRQLLKQWVERIEGFLGIPKKDIGVIGQGKRKTGKQITVASIQSLAKVDSSLHGEFGTIIVDECHRVPGKTFRETLQLFKSVYLYGLTATPFRKHTDDKLIFAYLGDIIAEVQPTQIETHKPATVIVRKTDLEVPYNSKIDPFEVLSKILIHDSTRNKLIAADVATELNKGRKAVILTERKEHLASLNLFLKQHYETITLSGDDSELDKRSKWKLLADGAFQVLLTTGQYFGEGTDLKSISTLFLVYPFSFKGKLIQYIGRVQRSEFNPIIYDYRDGRINYLNRMFLKRNTHYRKISRQATLFDEPTEDLQVSVENHWTIEKKIKVAIEELEFHYGSLVFNFKVEEMHGALEFQVENAALRPEFEVLKPYISRVLKSKKVTMEIYAEFVYGKLISQSAASQDIEKINKDVIEGLRFRFLNKGLIGKIPTDDKHIHTVEQLQDQNQLYTDAEALLEDVLRQGDYEHFHQVRYLANRHQGRLLKIRFVLNPFSFLFLLKAADKLFLVLETLDTQEATYIWKLEHETLLEAALGDTEKNLQVIKDKGRQVFLEDPPENFVRVFHDYADKDKGFELWKKLVEQELIC